MKAILVLLLLMPLAGCIGYPPDAARFGDRASISYDAYDLATGQVVLRNATAQLVVGSPSAVGLDVSRALIGNRVGDTLRVESRNDPGRLLTQTRYSPSELDRFPAQQSVPRTSFEFTLGPAEVGQEYPFRAARLTVTQLNETHVTIRYLDADTPVPEFGLRQVFTVSGDQVTVRIEPMENAATFQGPIEGLLPDAGTYRARGMDGDRVVYDFNPVAHKDLVGKDLVFQVTVLSVTRGNAVPQAPEGEYGHRASPQLLRDPSRIA
jgi:hypothetical protein